MAVTPDAFRSTGNTAARPATPGQGAVHWNTETEVIEQWSGAAWVTLFDFSGYATTVEVEALDAGDVGADPAGTTAAHAALTNNPHSVTADQVGLGNVENIKHTIDATDDPDANDDSSDQYSEGSIWINVTDDRAWICVDPAVGAAVWRRVGPELRQIVWTVEGDVAVIPSPLRLHNRYGVDLVIREVHLAVSDAPTGAALIVDIHQDGTTIFTTQANRPEIAAAAFTGFSDTIEVPTWAAGSYLTMEVDQIGSVDAGSNLVVTLLAEG